MSSRNINKHWNPINIDRVIDRNAKFIDKSAEKVEAPVGKLYQPSTFLNKCFELYFACSNQKSYSSQEWQYQTANTSRSLLESFSKIKLFEPQDANEKMNNGMMVNAHMAS